MVCQLPLTVALEGHCYPPHNYENQTFYVTKFLLFTRLLYAGIIYPYQKIICISQGTLFLKRNTENESGISGRPYSCVDDLAPTFWTSIFVHGTIRVNSFLPSHKDSTTVTHPSTNQGQCCLTQVYQAVGCSSMPITIAFRFCSNPQV